MGTASPLGMDARAKGGTVIKEAFEHVFSQKDLRWS